jgi:LDH2 family malate/lactate/ureidoglycolate dehydrogenase
MTSAIYRSETLVAFTRDVLSALGLPGREADTVATAIVEANLTGFDSHGMIRLPQYAPLLRAGRINARPNVHVTQRSPATALVDGDNGMGHLVMRFAAQTAVELARESGIGWVGARRSNHAGAAGIYVGIPLAAGMIGIYGANSSANHMAPWGGAEALLGTNPLAVAIPAGREAPVVLDMATSVTSFGVIRKHALEGKPLPEGWAVDPEDGTSVTDARKAAEALLLPIGGYKGSGLALIIGLLAGVLNGAAFGREVKEFSAEAAGEGNTGQFIIALDVARFQPLEQFKAELDRQIGVLRNSKALPGVEAVRIPGEDRVRRRAERMKNGIPIPPALVQQLDAVANEAGVALLSSR